MIMENEEEFSAAELEQQIQERRNEIMAREARMLEIQSRMADLDREMRTLRMEKLEITDHKSSQVREIRNLERDLEKARRFEHAQQERERLQREYDEQAAELDVLTSAAPWRVGIEHSDKILKAFHHQIEGGKRLAVAKRGILADKRGLGKSLTGLVYLDCVQAKKILLIAPNDVVPQFEGEIQMWAFHRRIMGFAGLNKDQRKIIYPMLKQLDSFIITLNYEAWRRDKSIIDDLIAAGLDTVILDEAHRAKSFSKITAKGIVQVVHSKNYCPECETVVEPEPWFKNGTYNNVNPLETQVHSVCGTKMVASVENVLSMTGTPMLNKPQEMFTMLHLVDPFRFNREEQFLRDYCYSWAPGRWKFTTGGLQRLINSMKEFFLQRTREDAGIEIPPPAVTIHYLDPDPVNYPLQYKAYKDLTQAAALVLEDGTAVDMLYILEIILRERQIMTWPAGVELKIRERDVDGNVVVRDIIRFNVEESQKLDAAVELCEELAEEGERFILFSKFKAPLYEAQRRLEAKGFKVTTATGDDSDWHRGRVRKDFDLKTADKENYNWVGVFATFDAFATGINLNAARHAIFLDDEWNPGMEDQAIGRIDRLNSEDQAQVHIFRVKGTVDIFMEELLKQKKDLTEGFEVDMSQVLKNYIQSGSGSI